MRYNCTSYSNVWTTQSTFSCRHQYSKCRITAIEWGIRRTHSSWKKIDVSLLVNQNFHTRGGRDGALDAMRPLETDGLDKLVLKKSKGSIRVCAPLKGTCTMLHILLTSDICIDMGIDQLRIGPGILMKRVNWTWRHSWLLLGARWNVLESTGKWRLPCSKRALCAN